MTNLERYQAQLLRQLRADAKTRQLAAKIERCLNRQRYRRSTDCKQLTCMQCRKPFISEQVKRARNRFEGHPPGCMHFITIPLDLLKSLVPAPDYANILDPNSLTLANDAEIKKYLTAKLRKCRADLDRALRSLNSDFLLCMGAFEFDVVDPATAGKQKLRFISDFHAAVPSSEYVAAPDLVLLHLHALVVVKRGDCYLTAEELKEALKPFFPHRYQLVVDPLMGNDPYATALMKRISYPLKTFTDFRDDRAREIAKALQAVGRRGVLYHRNWRRRPKVKSKAPKPSASQPRENRLARITRLARHRTSSHTAKDPS